MRWFQTSEGCSRRQSGWVSVWLALWTSRGARWMASLPASEPHGQRHRANLKAGLLRLSRGQDPRARCLWGAGGGLAAQHTSQLGNAASGFLFSLPVVVSALSVENENLFGRGPNAGDAIVLASAPAPGRLALPGVSPGAHRSWDGLSGASTQPPSWPGTQILGSSWPGLPSHSVPDASKQVSCPCPPLTNCTSPEGRKEGRKEGREGGWREDCNPILCVCVCLCVW